LLYFTHLPRSPQWTDLHEILHGGSSRRRNHLFQILCRSAEGFRICAGSNFAILPLLSRSPLTQGWRYRAACDTATFINLFSHICTSATVTGIGTCRADYNLLGGFGTSKIVGTAEVEVYFCQLGCKIGWVQNAFHKPSSLL